jgi:hypothetical protein
VNALPAADAASRTAEEGLRALGTSAEEGLSGALAKRRLEEFGSNVLDRASGSTIYSSALPLWGALLRLLRRLSPRAARFSARRAWWRGA